MQLNFTFFVQIINFGITYWFLNKFMFEPVMVFLTKEKDKEKEINDLLAQKEQSLLELENEKYEKLMRFKRNMKKKYTVSSPTEPLISSKVSCDIDKEEAKKLVIMAKRVLQKKVPHVD